MTTMHQSNRTAKSDRKLILNHYREQARKWKDDARSTMEDETIRTLEMEKISECLALIIERNGAEPSGFTVGDIGCGNGYAVAQLQRDFPCSFVGMDLSQDMLAVAQSRELPGVRFVQGDIVADPGLEEGSLDVAYSERCLINILDADEQFQGLANIGRLLKPGGHYIMVESFTDGLALVNKARAEVGLDAIHPAYHNRYIDKDRFLDVIGDKFEIADLEESTNDGGGSATGHNFLSSYWFMSRVFYPLTTKAPVVRNTEFVKFFSFLPPIGNYAPTQCYVLRRKDR